MPGTDCRDVPMSASLDPVLMSVVLRLLDSMEQYILEKGLEPVFFQVSIVK